MSDTSQGPGYWQASDGKWYPPEKHPDANYRSQGAETVAINVPPVAPGPPPSASSLAPPAGFEPPVAGAPPGYSPAPSSPGFAPQGLGAPAAGQLTWAQLQVNSPYECANWRPLAHWAMAIPHFFMSYVAQIASQIGYFLAWWVVLFTGKVPPGLYNLMTMGPRSWARTITFLYGFSEVYPPFELPGGQIDNGNYPPVRVDFPPERPAITRLALIHWLLAIPHLIFMYILFIGVYVVALIAWFAVLFTGKWPSGMRDFIVKVLAYNTRVQSYVLMMTDQYPAFGIS